MNPVNGGSPPNDSKLINIEIFKNLEVVVNENIWLKWKILNELNIKIMVIDSIE